ncbi:hypothetical protein PJF56_13140 [Roseofilum sp. BLCC_M91]|uniref:DUF2157 domain-containing protein n=1 Tax=Roseofilum halophilum BLCC-M91 TaxID=3022259 RepID=A0ABT7BMW1_9CYAN|nr:hypothetical protein [Roseofilum halophilum]MDJ1179811.1 hypothetical protein [Roseofilum halophilum BLCC-M91]
MAPVPESIIEIELDPALPINSVLEGLKLWQDLGILTEDSVYLCLKVDTRHPRFLEGLEIGLRLGLIDPLRVKQIAHNYLCCTIPEPQKIAPQVIAPPVAEQPPILSTPVLRTAPTVFKPSWIGQRLESLKAELSVRWLLFLGLFLVVLSSGVFAASQWENFPAIAQYGVLLGYTSLFWLISRLASQKENLELTSQALKLVTLLLIPVNFWAMDDFGLWSHPVNGLASLGSAVYLTVMAGSLWQTKTRVSLGFPIYLLASYLHWGWGVPNFPIFSVYLATLGSLGFYVYQFQNLQNSLKQTLRLSRLSLYAIGILLFRAIFVQGVVLPHLGLAIALCGTFTVWLSFTRRSQYHKPINRLGLTLLFFAWFVSIWVTFPWQGVVISLIATQIYQQFIARWQHRRDLAILWLIGVQMSLLLWSFVPEMLQSQIIATAVEITQAQEVPIALISAIGLPYLIWIVHMGDRFYRREKPKLAHFSEFVALGLGISLLIFSFPNAILRIFCLTNLVFLLMWVTKRRYDLHILHSFHLLVYLNHCTGLALLLSLIHYVNSNLSLNTWALILLAMTVMEWWFSDLRRSLEPSEYEKIWQQSAWLIGFGLGAIAYLLLFSTLKEYTFTFAHLPWLAIPATLTLISYSPHSHKQDLAPKLSIVMLFLAQALVLETPGWRVFGLAVATLIMVFNTRKLPHIATATLTMGCALSALGLILWDLVPGMPPAIDPLWLMLGAIAASPLWGIRHYTLRKSIPHYTQALDIWAIALCGTVLTLQGIWVSQELLTPTYLSISTSMLLSGATAYRSWYPKPKPTAIGWSSAAVMVAVLPTMKVFDLRCLSLLVATFIFIGHSRYSRQLYLTAMTVGLGLVTERVILSDWIDIPSTTWWIVGAVNVLGLWIGAKHLRLGKAQWQRQLTRLYRKSFHGWAIALCLFCLTLLTLHSVLVYINTIPPQITVFISLILLFIALLYSQKTRPHHPLGAGLFRFWENSQTTGEPAPYSQTQNPRHSLGAGLFRLGENSQTTGEPAPYSQTQNPRHSLGAGLFRLGENSQTTGEPAPTITNWKLLAIAWTIELLAVETLASFDSPIINLALVNLILGLCAQLFGDWWSSKQPSESQNLRAAWHIIPLAYGILGALLRWGTVSSWTGVTTLALAIIILGIGKRSPKFKPLIYLALAGVTACAYELLFYQLSLQPSGATGDGLILMATLGSGILYAYRLLGKFLRPYFQLTSREFRSICHLHWFASSLLLIIATFNPIQQGMTLGFATGATLVLYAISQGRRANSPVSIAPSPVGEGVGGEGTSPVGEGVGGEGTSPTGEGVGGEGTSPVGEGVGGEGTPPTGEVKPQELWVYLGFLEALGMRIYWLNTPIAQLLGGPLVAWKGAIATLFAYFLYFLPWQTWGWSKRPWQLAGIAIPLYAMVENPTILNQASLVVIAAYYIGLAIASKQIRFTYLTVAVLNWIIWRYFLEISITEIFWYALTISLSLLYIIQVDPLLKSTQNRKLRHNLRTLISVIISLTSFTAQQWIGTLTGTLSLLTIFAGLSLKTRAFLYVGTTTFLLNIFYQLGILIFDYPFSKWLVALGVGISLIWIAATFETRREQIQAWFQELQHWE